MPIYTKRIVFGAKNYQSGLAVEIYVFNLDGTLVTNKNGIEIGTLGIYYADFELNTSQDYIIIAQEFTELQCNILIDSYSEIHKSYDGKLYTGYVTAMGQAIIVPNSYDVCKVILYKKGW